MQKVRKSVLDQERSDLHLGNAKIVTALAGRQHCWKSAVRSKLLKYTNRSTYLLQICSFVVLNEISSARPHTHRSYPFHNTSWSLRLMTDQSFVGRSLK